MDPQEALEGGFSQWLDDVAGGHRVRQARPLDPYATSWRNSGRGVAWLKSIEGGSQPQTADPGQNVTDLRNAGLVEGGGSVQPTLTPLGSAALTMWREHGIDNPDERDEVARAAATVRCALNLGVPKYVEMFDFWCELLNLRPAVAWFGDVPGLYLVSYLNRTSPSGYNPYRVLVALGHDFSDSLPSWTAWAASAGSAPLSKLVRAVTDFSNRPGGRRTFCQGMEAVRLTRSGVDDLPGLIADWGLPA
jgi:hypothetical protein